MRVVTCIGSTCSGKTCLLNILQGPANDGKCFSIEEQDRIKVIQEEFNHKPADNTTVINTDAVVSNDEFGGRNRLKYSNKIVPTTNGVLKKLDLKTQCLNGKFAVSENKNIFERNIEPNYYSSLLGKTAPTAGVNHFEFIVSDLTLQVAGKYRQRQRKEHNNICSNIGCRCTKVNNERFDVIELRELGGEIGKFLEIRDCKPLPTPNFRTFRG